MRPDRRALPQQREGLGVLEPLSKRVDVLGVIVPDGHMVVRDLLEAAQCSDGVLIIVKDGDVHNRVVAYRPLPPSEMQFKPAVEAAPPPNACHPQQYRTHFSGITYLSLSFFRYSGYLV